MTEFEYDCLQEEQMERGIRRRIGGKRQVTLPSDNLPLRELERRNGPCRTYRLGRPMTRKEFEDLPADLKTRYLRQLRQQGGSASDVERMLELPGGGLRPYRVVFDRENAERWQAFLASGRKEG